MRTSREAYHRIRWDPRLDPARFVIGYESRRPEPSEVAFAAFVPDGDIPWHRVLYFREGETIVWDRRTRVDTLFDAAPARAAAPRLASIEPGAFFQPIPLHRFDRRSGAWLPVEVLAEPSGGAPGPAVRLATFNVLCDAFDDMKTDLPERIPALLAHLRAIDADVIALQEASPAFLRPLLAERWVREAYAVSDGPAGRTVDPHGVLLLTRLPVAQLVEHRFSRTKRAVVAEVRAGGAPLHVGVVHLTSDRAPNAAETRKAHLEALCAALPPAGEGAPPAALLGDFNWDDDDLAGLMARHGFGDAWTALHPGDPGLTFDPARNALAARTSTTQRRARLDRIFLRDGALAMTAAEAALFATEPAGRTEPPLFPSDHFGLLVRARLRPIETVAPAPEPAAVAEPSPTPAGLPKPTYHTAVVVIPPAAYWPRIQAIRLAYDRSAERWMPHVTLLYGFVPEERFEEAREAMAEALAGIEPFEVTLSGIGTFAQRQSSTVWTKPEADPPGSLHALQAALERAFPQCDEQGRKSPAGYTPHLSLAQLADRDPEAGALLARWRAEWEPIRFPVREVALIARRGESPFEVRHVVPVGAAAPPLDPRDVPLARALGDVASDDAAARRAAVGHLADACVAALPGEDGRGALRLTGAARLGVAEAGADVDAIAVGPGHVSREAFFAATREWLEVVGGTARIVGDGVAPVLRGVVAAVPVDLGYAAMPPDLLRKAPETLTPAELDRLDPASRNALAAVRDAASVRSVVASRGEPAFRTALRALKRWARARGLYSNAFGYLSGFGWTLLAAWGLAEEGEPTASAALGRAFDVLGVCDPSHPVALTKEAAAYLARPRDILVLPSPSAPPRNVARNLTRGTAAVLRAEATRAGAIVARARRGDLAWSTLFEPFDAITRADPRLRIELLALDEPALSAGAGWLEGHVLGLLLDLEAGPASRPRPDPRRTAVEGGVRWEILLGDDGVDLAGAAGEARRFEEAFAAWEGRPAGTSISVEVREGRRS